MEEEEGGKIIVNGCGITYYGGICMDWRIVRPNFFNALVNLKRGVLRSIKEILDIAGEARKAGKTEAYVDGTGTFTVMELTRICVEQYQQNVELFQHCQAAMMKMGNLNKATLWDYLWKDYLENRLGSNEALPNRVACELLNRDYRVNWDDIMFLNLYCHCRELADILVEKGGDYLDKHYGDR